MYCSYLKRISAPDKVDFSGVVDASEGFSVGTYDANAMMSSYRALTIELILSQVPY